MYPCEEVERMKTFIIVLLAVCLLSGCATTKFKYANGDEVTHTSLFMTSNVFFENGKCKLIITKQTIDMSFITSVLDAYLESKTGKQP